MIAAPWGHRSVMGREGFERRSQTTAAPLGRVSDSLTNVGGAVTPRGYGLSEATKDGIWELRAEG
jgi:hypothetical protein